MDEKEVFAYFDESMGKKTRFLVKNEQYQKDVKHAVELNRRIANIIGIWPIFPTNTSNLNLQLCVKRLKNVFLYFLLLFLIIPGILHIVLEEHTLKRKLLKTGPMILNTMAMVKYTMILFREHKIRRCINFLESDWQNIGIQELRTIMRRNASLGRRLSRISAMTFYSAGLCYRLINTLLTPYMHRGGLIYKPLPSPLFAGIFRFNTSARGVYEAIFATQMMGGFAVHSTTITTCSYAALLATHACGQLDIVVHLLKRLIDEDDDNGRLTKARDAIVGKRLKIIVRSHLKVLRFVDDVEDLLHTIIFVEIVGGTTILCLTGYSFILDLEKNNAFSTLTYTVMITSLVALLFTYCYIGELLSGKAKMIGECSYMINWNKLPPTKMLYIGLIISISRYPTKLTGGKIFELSMYNFGSIMRSAASYLNLLRTVTE